MSNPNSNGDPEDDGAVHQGKWTPEEEEYVQGLIDEFKAGMLPLAEGTSLRTFLSKMLNCQPMRISKKFVGTNYNGKQVYVRRKNKMSNEEVRERRAKLQELERKFLAKAQPIMQVTAGSPCQGATAAGASPTTAAKAPVDPSSQVAMLSALAAAGGGGSMSALDSAAMEALFGSGGNAAGGLDAEALLGGAVNRNPAAAAGRALLGGDFKPAATAATDSAGGDAGGIEGGLGGFSSAQLAAELRKRTGGVEGILGASSAAAKRSTSIEDLLAGGVASELQKRASVENLVAKSNLLNAARNSFHGTSAGDLLKAAQMRKNSASNLLNAARNSFHKNSTSNLLNAAAGSFARQGSASNLLNAEFRKKLSSSNLLNAAVSARQLSSSNLLNAAVSARKLSSSNLLSAAASVRTLSSSNLLNAARASNSNMTALQTMLAARERGGGDAPASSMSEIIERHNSMNFQRKMSGLMENIQQQAGGGGNKNWSASSSGRGLTSSSGSRSNLVNLRMSMQNELQNEPNGGASLLNNAAFAAVAAGGDGASRLELAKLLGEQGFDGDSTSSVLAKLQQSKERSLGGNASSLDKEALLQQLRGSSGGGGGGGTSSAIEEYLLSQQRAEAEKNSDSAAQASGGDLTTNEAELTAMMNLKRKFLQDGESLEELAKRMKER